MGRYRSELCADGPGFDTCFVVRRLQEIGFSRMSVGLLRGPERRLFSLMKNMRIGVPPPAVEKMPWNFDAPG